MKNFTKEMTRGEANKLFLALTIIGFAIVTIVTGFVGSPQITHAQNNGMYWLGVDSVIAGAIALIVNNVSQD